MNLSSPSKPWPFSPAIIARVERYCGCTLCRTIGIPSAPVVSHELTFEGRAVEFANYDNAEIVAYAILGWPAFRTGWRCGWAPEKLLNAAYDFLGISLVTA